MASSTSHASIKGYRSIRVPNIGAHARLDLTSVTMMIALPQGPVTLCLVNFAESGWI